MPTTSSFSSELPPTPTPNFSRDIEKIRAKLDEKGGNKYSSLDQPLDKPLVAALQLWHHVDEVELRNVLFGTEQVEWLVDNATGSVVPPNPLETYVSQMAIGARASIRVVHAYPACSLAIPSAPTA
jgi:hypothetical protein